MTTTTRDEAEMSQERESETIYLAGAWSIDRRLWKRPLLNAFRRKTRLFQKQVDSHGYDGAAILVAGKLWQALAAPLAIIGGALFAFSSRLPLERFAAYVVWAVALSVMTIAMVHAVQGGSRRWR